MQSISESPRNKVVARRVVLFGTPLLLAILELAHPLLDHRHTISMLTPIATWWIILHLLLVPLFALMGWTFFLLLEGIQSRAAMLSRYATVVYIAFTIGYDTAVGLNTGVLVSNALALPATEKAILQQAITQIFSSPAIVLSYYILLISGIVAIGAAVWALVGAGVPRIPALVLLGAAVSAYSHALPFGPFGSVCFLLAALWIELVWRKQAQQERKKEEAVATVGAV